MTSSAATRILLVLFILILKKNTRVGKRTKNPNTKDGGLFAAYLNDPANWQHVGAVTFTLGATATRFPFATLARTIEELAAETMHRIETGRLMPYEG